MLWGVSFGLRRLKTLSHPRVPHEAAKKRFGVLRQLSRDALSLVESDDPSLEAESIRLLRYARPSDALPHLINRITDRNPSIKKVTRSVLSTLAQHHLA